LHQVVVDCLVAVQILAVGEGYQGEVDYQEVAAE
jgi:hypothetical protein